MMMNLGVSWKWKFAFVAVGLALGSISVLAVAAEPDASQACVSADVPGVLSLQYDAAGHLALAEDLQGRANARFDFRGSALDDISVTHYIKDLAKPDRYGQTEQWGPVRWSEYDLKTGKLKVIHAYERGRQLTFNVPADATLDSGQFTGSPESCDVMYDDCKTLEARTIPLTEPTHFDAGAADGACLSFAGMKIALKKASPADPSVDEDNGASVKPAPGGNSRQVCIGQDCITVLGDDTPADEPAPSQQTPAN